MHKKRLMRSMHSVLCMMFLTIFFCSTTWAQTLTIRLINAKSGKAMRNQSVTFHWGEGSASSSVTVDHDGAAHVEVPVGATQFYMSPGPRQGKEALPNCLSRLQWVKCNAHLNLGCSSQWCYSKEFMQSEKHFWAFRRSGFLGVAKTAYRHAIKRK
jgi:hypothetical protein